MLALSNERFIVSPTTTKPKNKHCKQTSLQVASKETSRRRRSMKHSVSLLFWKNFSRETQQHAGLLKNKIWENIKSEAMCMSQQFNCQPAAWISKKRYQKH